MSESLTRTISGIVYIALLLGATLISPITFELLFVVFLGIAVTEYCKLANLDKKLPLAIAALGVLLFGIYISKDFLINLLLTAAALFIAVGMLVELFKDAPTQMRDGYGKLARLIGYVVIPFLLIIKLPYVHGEYNPYIIIGMFIIIWANDTFAYIVGKAIGENKLFERVSPKKTIEGFVGGVLFATAFAYTLGLFYKFLTPWQWMAFAAIVSVFGTLGDLVESKLKRNAGVKDSGNIMPGHGGILDRLDSVIFAIPFLFLYYLLIS